MNNFCFYGNPPNYIFAPNIKYYVVDKYLTNKQFSGAVDKYRLRRKFPLPRTIWDGEETVYCFKVLQIQIIVKIVLVLMMMKNMAQNDNMGDCLLFQAIGIQIIMMLILIMCKHGSK